MELNKKASWIRHEEHLKVTTIIRNSFLSLVLGKYWALRFIEMINEKLLNTKYRSAELLSVMCAAQVKIIVDVRSKNSFKILSSNYKSQAIPL